jgi:dTMP kinase
MKIPGLIAFEGVDGAGKTTVIGLVAAALRERGHEVYLPRDGKDPGSKPAKLIRDLARDAENLDLTARAELALYCAREAQILEESVRPALARGEVVLIDRSLLTPVVLGSYGRGLARGLCESMAAAAADGLHPDVTMVFDVHPRTSRMRKRIEKIRNRSQSDGGGRKGLAGSGLKERTRDGYLAIAKERNFPVFHAERSTPEEIARRVLRFLESGARPEDTEDPLEAHPLWMVDPSLPFTDALRRLPPAVALFLANGLVAGRALRAEHFEAEPQLVAWSLDAEDPLRRACLHSEVDYALRGWSKRPLSGPDDMRYELLELYPSRVISTLKYQSSAESDKLRMRYAAEAPAGVLVSLAGREDPRGMDLRRACWKGGSTSHRATSLALCSSHAAWKLREKVFEHSIALGLESLRGVSNGDTDRLLTRYASKAEKCVLRALAGRSDRLAHGLRRSLLPAGREVLDSIRGLDDPESWALREEHAIRYPSTVLHSLSGIFTPRAASMRKHCEELGAGDMHMMRRSVELDEFTAQPEWTRTRLALSETDS